MNYQTMLLAQEGSGGVGGAIVSLIYLAILLAVIAGGWKMFVKAGQPGWGIFVPIYNLYLLLKVADRPGWWLFLLLVPVVNFIVLVVVAIDIAKSFDKDFGFAAGLFFLGFIFYPLLGFGHAKYHLVHH